MITGNASTAAHTLLGRYSGQLTRLADRSLAELAIDRGRKLVRTDALMRTIVQHSFDAIIAFDVVGRAQMANAAAAQIFGVDEEALIGVSFAALFPEFDRFKLVPCAHAGRDGGRFEGTGRRRDGRAFPAELSLRRIAVGDEQLLVGIVRDITERRQQERRLRYLALHDALTGLANRVLLHDRLERELVRSRREDLPLALLLVDLDRFKDVNDTLGHDVGDVMLREFGRRLSGCARPRDTVARLGGDEFALLLAAGTDTDGALAVATRILEAVRQPIVLTSDALIEVGISVGIACAPAHADDATTLLRYADVAMYSAKGSPDPVAFYDRDKDRHSLRTLALAGALRRAIESDELIMLYQPKLNLATGVLGSVEALARWRHPQHGTIMPTDFIPQAEQTGVIHEVTRWTLETVLHQAARWRRQGLYVGVAVNLSSRSLHHERLPDLVGALLERYEVEPALLTVELTESAVVHDVEAAAQVLARLQQMGVTLSVDDFGTGYSSLALLQRLSVQELKIDRSFVATMLDNDADRVIVRSTIDLARSLGLRTVAEGVESDAQLRALRAMGCDSAQGFLIAQPMGARELVDVLRRFRWDHACVAG
jgi:diguanylate cyclase (GGDEF)-like protein/PAS domain S-box-containing protein